MASPPSSFPHLALIGAGITSLTLSIRLSALQIPHTIYEQSSSLTELGAGLSFGPNAVRALQHIDSRFVDVFNKTATFVGTPSSQGKRILEDEEEWREGDQVWIEFLDGTKQGGDVTPEFVIKAGNGKGHAAVHRGKWLDVLGGLVTAEIQFGKRLVDVVRPDGVKRWVKMVFGDGTEVEADAVVGCDGVKSRVREVLVEALHGEGEGRTNGKCGYSGKYAYRCLVPWDKAVEAVGEDRVGVSSLWMGPNRHLLTFPVNRQEERFLNLVAFVTDQSQTWPSQGPASLTMPATKMDALKDFERAGFSDTWGLHDVADRPLSSFFSDRIIVIGDAAHASTPHHGSGAGFCMEDVAILGALFEEAIAHKALTVNTLQEIFTVFDAHRRERDQWLVNSSRRAADLYQWRIPEFSGQERFEKMKADIEQRQKVCWDFDMESAIERAERDLKELLDTATR
ncbi:putative salicylate hydroxylase [Triangularia verruculosa]|uniref:Salicylate hydroxylase n=1 Tax=Triangularia verruculosa TaxID=2587418 RepID=A0AAN7ARY2_9PEZI|nr:putative salicylate hydroxylase [Triangularia verruculosa]